jgi:hypothetical protein
MCHEQESQRNVNTVRSEVSLSSREHVSVMLEQPRCGSRHILPIDIRYKPRRNVNEFLVNEKQLFPRRLNP